MKDYKLPSNWGEVTFEQYIAIALIDQNIGEFEIGIEIVKIFTKMTDKEINGLKLKELNNLVDKSISWMSTPPADNKKVNYKLKSVSNIGYDDFVTYKKLESDLSNVALILEVYSDIPSDQWNKMNCEDVLSAFFLLKKKLLKFTAFSLAFLTAKTALKKIWKWVLAPFRKK